MTTAGPLRSQTHPRASGTKQSWPLTNGCGRMRVSGASRMVTRSSRSMSSQACRSWRQRGMRSSCGDSNGVVADKIRKVTRANSINPRAQVGLVRVRGGNGEGRAEPRIGALTPQTCIFHGVFGERLRKKAAFRSGWIARAPPAQLEVSLEATRACTPGATYEQ
eukprot:3396203-Pleurochrysis_carterae.AAC.2